MYVSNGHMLSVDSKVIGIAIEHRNPINQSADFVVWKEGKTRVYRNGEISRGSAVLEGTIHVIQGLYVNWREPVSSFLSV